PRATHGRSHKAARPRASRGGLLRGPATTVGLEEYKVAGQALELRVHFVEVRSVEDLGGAFATMVRDRVDALLVPGDTLLFTERQRVAALAHEHRLPGIYSLRELTDGGRLL